LTSYYAHMLEYRAEIVLWMLAGVLPFILMGVWEQAADGGATSLRRLELTRYFLAVFVVRQLSVVWVIWEFERQVVEGRLSPYLLQPLDPVWRHVAKHVSERFARAPFFVALVALFFCLRPESFWVPSLRSASLALIATVMAFALRFVIQYSFAMLTFWTERASSLTSFWFLFYLFLSGYIAPLELYPESVRAFALWTPFPYLVHFPARLMVGAEVDLLRGFSIMLAWGLVFLLVNRVLWRAGLRHYSAMGA
jgi:ABC-2 type transport system permease protein